MSPEAQRLAIAEACGCQQEDAFAAATFATAAQRAEAFLRTLNLWDDSK